MKRKVKILIVDDEDSSQHLLKNHLVNLGFLDMVSAEDGEAALKILQSQKIDLIIADWHMPGKNGIEVYETLQEDKELKSIPFLMITAESDKEQVMKAMKIGIRNYIIKPVYSHVLKEKINSLLKLQ